MPSFVRPDSIVRRIWSDGDTILLVFAAAAAEFALNRAVDWLFVTERLPKDPLGRLFSTVRNAQRIALGDRDSAERAIAGIRMAHADVERRRGARIPDWAYRDVLYMLIGCSECAFERLHRRLTAAEREELYAVFHRLGEGLGIPGLPSGYAAWRLDRERHLERDLEFSPYTEALYASYRRQLGPWRYQLLLQLQATLVHERVRVLLRLPRIAWFGPILPLYGALGRPSVRALAQRALIPESYRDAVRQLDWPVAE